MGGTAGVQFPLGEGNVCLLHSVKTGSVIHPDSHPMDDPGSSPEGKVAGDSK